MGSHIIASEGFRKPEDCGYIQSAGENKVITEDFVSRLVTMARFRNLLVYIYIIIDLDKVYDILNNNLTDLETFARYILEYIKNK